MGAGPVAAESFPHDLGGVRQRFLDAGVSSGSQRSGYLGELAALMGLALMDSGQSAARS